MATLSIVKPDILILEFQQDKSDKDYGSCLWARFHIDKKRYTLTIDSDCGHFAYTWIPTEQESFIHLLSRFQKDYFLSKIAEETYINSAKTFELIKKYIEEIAYKSECEKIDWLDIKDICRNTSIDAVTSGLKDVIPYDLMCRIDEFELFNCLITTYSPQAQTIADIFIKYVIPYLKLIENSEYENHSSVVINM